MPKTIAIIPAKGHSRRIANKNMALLGGEPLLSYILRAVKRSPLIDEVFVSTDDEEIASLARSLGASVPFLRDPALSGDHVHGTEPVLDMLRKLYSTVPDSLFCLRALAPYPFLTTETITALVQKSHEAKKAVLSLVPLDINEHHLRTINQNGTIAPVAKNAAVNFQIDDAAPLYALCGAAQCMPAKQLLEQGSYQKNFPLGFPLQNLEWFEVDTPEMLALAEKLLPVLGPAKQP